MLFCACISMHQANKQSTRCPVLQQFIVQPDESKENIAKHGRERKRERASEGGKSRKMFKYRFYNKSLSIRSCCFVLILVYCRYRLLLSNQLCPSRISVRFAGLQPLVPTVVKHTIHKNERISTFYAHSLVAGYVFNVEWMQCFPFGSVDLCWTYSSIEKELSQGRERKCWFQ